MPKLVALPVRGYPDIYVNPTRVTLIRESGEAETLVEFEGDKREAIALPIAKVRDTLFLNIILAEAAERASRPTWRHRRFLRRVAQAPDRERVDRSGNVEYGDDSPLSGGTPTSGPLYGEAFFR